MDKSPATRALAALIMVIIVIAVASPVHGVLARPLASKGIPTLRWEGLVGLGGSQWLDTLDPAFATDETSINMVTLVNANLVKILPNGQVGGDLASKVSLSKNHRTYTFILRKNLHFSNGDAITAHDVAWSITRSLLKRTGSPLSSEYLPLIVGAPAALSGKAKRVTGLRVVSDRVIQITISKPVAFFLDTLSYPTADVLDPRILRAKPVNTWLTDTCTGNVGAGPFKFACRNRSSDPGHSSFFAPGTTPSVTLAPNGRYYGPVPRIKLFMPVIATAEVAFDEFQDNEIDVTPVPSIDVQALKHDKGFFSYPTSTVDYLTPNFHTGSALHNIHCRLAVAYALDRPTLDGRVVHGVETPTYQILPASFQGLGYYPAGVHGKSWSPHYNLAKAKAELALCPGGIHHLTIPFPNISSDERNLSDAVVYMLGQAGIGAKAELISADTWYAILASPNGLDNTPIGKLSISYGSWVADYPDPEDFMTLLLRGGQYYNIGYFDDPLYNRIVDKAAITFNRRERAGLYIRAQHIALTQGAWISIGNLHDFELVSVKVHGLTTNPILGLIPKGNNWANISIR